MAGDYTKFTFRPGKDYSGVWKQQGRVDLDADWNEYVEIADRRWRVETVDIIGPCVVPNTTPDAFLITPTGPSTVEIGIGRMYVHGLMAENHGRPPLKYDAVFGEEVGTVRIPYSDQPYLPAPLPAPLAATPGTTDLIFIDVWQREVTYLEDPAIQEIALGGPDTATRVQTAWQVRALTNVGRHECPDPIEAWDALIAPSGARLTTSAVAPPASDDPCILSPAGGYRGLENRLYRVEIHSVGTIGGVTPAKFKWSRDNGSIASLVDAIDGTSTQITVRRIGRDQVLRFHVGEWVEILDDHTEFRQIAGHTAQVTAIDEANRVVTFAPAIPAGFGFDATNPARHTRVRRWDQTVGVDANGLLDVVPGPIDIEDGVQVTFTGSNFKIGDFWVFAARTADASVEPLTNAPPRGILHHFCRLGFMTWVAGALGRFLDCRNKWPPGFPPPGPGGKGEECECCTVTVGDGVDSHGDFTDIQLAIDSLGPAGGLVCVLRGVFEVREPIVLRSLRNIIVRGMGPATRVVFVGESDFTRNVISLINCEDVRLESMFIASRRALAIVHMMGCRLCRVEDCTVVNLEVQDPVSNQPSGRAIEISEGSQGIELRRNLMLAAKGVAGLDRSRTRRLAVMDNQFATVQVGILMVEVEDLDVIHNRLRGLGREDLAKLRGLPPPTRPTVDAFQLEVNRVFLLPATSLELQAAGILVVSGNRVLIRESLIIGQIGVLAFSAIALALEGNDVFSLMGVLVGNATNVRVNDCALMSQLAGIVHTGFLLNFLCDANLLLGRTGIVFLSRRQFAATIGLELDKALGQFTSNVAALVGSFAPPAAAAVFVSDAVALAMTVKIDRNQFLTFQDGVHKMAEVASEDFSIIDNAFAGCRRFAIQIEGSGAPAVPDVLGGLANPRHLIQANALTVTGPAIASAMPFTAVLDNQIECPDAGIEITAPFCEVRGNSVRGTGQEPRPDTGLIIAGRRSRLLTIDGNRLLGGPCNGILVASSTRDLRVESNEIEGMAMNGITTADPSVQIANGIVSRNVIRRCRLGTNGARPWFSAAIAISAGNDLRIVGNVVEGNESEITETTLTAFLSGIYAEDVTGVEIDTNQVHDNFLNSPAAAFTAGIACARIDGTLAVTGNSVRVANGTAITVNGKTDGVVNGNRVGGTGQPRFPFVFIQTGLSTQFNNNMVLERQGVLTDFALVDITSSRVVAVGNILETRTRFTALESSGDVAISGNNVVAQRRAIVVTGTRGVISSNVVTSGVLAPITVLQVNNV